ncbi:hypothetical protein AUP68_05689 [Ilyonectria robusta]
MHRNEATFGPDPEEFVPERWENLRPGWGYLPFNGGARSCVGRKFSRHDSAESCTMLILISCRTIRTSGDSLRRRKDGSDFQDAGVPRRGRVDGAKHPNCPYQHTARTIDCGGMHATRLHHLEKSPTDSVLSPLVIRVARTMVHLEAFDTSKFEH